MPLSTPAAHLVTDALGWCLQHDLCTQASLAAHLGVARQTVSRWVRGDRELPDDRALLAELLSHLGEDAPVLLEMLAWRLRLRAAQQRREPVRQPLGELHRLHQRVQAIDRACTEAAYAAGEEATLAAVDGVLVEFDRAREPYTAERLAQLHRTAA